MKSERVTEWPAAKLNSIVSPTAAVRVSGVKTSPFLPTATLWILDAEAAAAALVAAVAVVEEEEDGELPYWPRTLERMEVRRRKENVDDTIMNVD